MDDWAAFLNARLDEDERRAIPGAVGLCGGSPAPEVLVCDFGLTHDLPGEPDGWKLDVSGLSRDEWERLADEHARTHADPRALREVQAKRAILADYLKAADDLEDPWVTNALLTALGHHMAVWDDHPDYPAARKSLKEAYWTP